MALFHLQAQQPGVSPVFEIKTGPIQDTPSTSGPLPSLLLAWQWGFLFMRNQGQVTTCLVCHEIGGVTLHTIDYGDVHSNCADKLLALLRSAASKKTARTGPTGKAQSSKRKK